MGKLAGKISDNIFFGRWHSVGNRRQWLISVSANPR